MGQFKLPVSTSKPFEGEDFLRRNRVPFQAIANIAQCHFGPRVEVEIQAGLDGSHEILIHIYDLRIRIYVDNTELSILPIDPGLYIQLIDKKFEKVMTQEMKDSLLVWEIMLS